MQTAWRSPPAGDLHAGARIANARGAVGTLGCFALTLDDRRPVLLTSEHVLFASGARVGDPVYTIGQKPHRVAIARHGRRGLVVHGGRQVHVDCASADLAPDLAESLRLTPCSPGAPVRHDAPVSMLVGSEAAAGTVVDTEYQGRARIAGRDFPTSGQILVRPRQRGEAFSKPGDSGAALRDADGAIVGIVWGATPLGEALACPIAPILWLLHLDLAR